MTSALLVLACAGAEDSGERARLEIVRLTPALTLDGTELYQPVAVDLDDDGNLHVLDQGNGRIYVYDPRGRLLRELGRRGGGPGEFPELSSSSRLVVSHEKSIVLMPGARRVQVFDLPSGIPSVTFTVTGFPTSLGFDGRELHVMMGMNPGDHPRAAVLRFSLRGELLGSYGEKLRPDWDEPSAPARLRGRNDGFLSVSEDGRVFVALTWWPWVRAFRDGELLWERWLDFAWVEEEQIAAIFRRSRESMLEFDESVLESDERNRRSSRLARTPVFLDLASSAGRMVALLNAGFVLVMDENGVPQSMYQLGAPRPSGEPVPAGYRDHIGARRIGLNPKGDRLCAPVRRLASVHCYTLSE